MKIKVFLLEMAKLMNKDAKQILSFSYIFKNHLINTVGDLKSLNAAEVKELDLPIILRKRIYAVLD